MLYEPPVRHHPRTRLVILVVGGLAFAGVMVAMRGGDRPAHAAKGETVPVTVTQAVERDLPIWRSGVGSVQPLEVVDVKPRVDGQIVSINFKEGDEVRAGALLAQIDPRPFKALVDQAVANKARDQAQLANARLDLGRATKLATIGAGTGQNVDTLKAQTAALAATVAADQALIDTARLNLGFTSVRAPISGRVGIRQVNTGAMVRASDPTGIVTVTQIAPIAAVFALPQDVLSDVRKAGPRPEVIVARRDGVGDLAHGTLSVIDSQVDPANGQVRLKASFANADRALWPGSLITARLLSHVMAHAVTVPASAVQISQSGNFVYLLKSDSTVLSRPVKLGPTVDGVTAILSGVKPGETVIVSGQSRIDTGVKVKPRPMGADADMAAAE